MRLTEVLNFRSLQGQSTLTEREDALRELTSALLSGKSDEAKQKAYAALAKGNNERDVLDTIVEAVDIISDLQGWVNTTRQRAPLSNPRSTLG